MKNGKAVRDVVGFLGVVGSLVFVGIEVRQNNQIAIANAYQQVGLRAAAVWTSFLHDPGTAALVAAGRDPSQWDSLSETDWFRLRASTMSGLRAWETVELQVEAGVLPPDASSRLGYNINYWPYLERVWPEIRPSLSEAFASHVEETFGLNRP